LLLRALQLRSLLTMLHYDMLRCPILCCFMLCCSSHALVLYFFSALQYFIVSSFAAACFITPFFAAPTSSALCFAADYMLLNASLLDILLP